MRCLMVGPPSRCRGAVIVVGMLVAVVVGLFGEALVGDRIFAFRDSAHTFPALYHLVRDEWLAGSVPLWNPQLNAGQPLAGCGVAGAFYPPQILITAILPDGLSLNVLVVAHVVLAGVAAGLIARDAGCSTPAATLAGLAYACSGSVLFQVYNPIIAAGAAWFACAVRAGLQLIRRFEAGDFLALAAALALAVLAGDPQAAFHAGLVLGLFALWHGRGSVAGLAIPMGRLVGAAAVAGALALVQITLSAEFMRETTRSTDAWPMSIWDVPRFLREAGAESLQTAPWYAVMIGRPPESVSFYHDVYRFSVAPWRCVELLSPTFGGPSFRRWPTAIGLERDAWTATLYAGALPLACMLAATWRKGDRRTTAWAILLLIAFLASLGGFGLVGAARQAIEWLSGERPPAAYATGDEVGGFYWMLVTFLPGYSGFRYPAKWLTPCALAYAELAAIGFDAMTTGSSRDFVRRSLIGIAVLAAACTPGAVMAAPAGDALFIAAGGAVAVASCVACLLMLRFAPAAAFGWPLVALAAVDLVVAGRFHSSVASFSALLEGAAVLGKLEENRLPACREAAGHPRLTAIDGLMADRDPGDIDAWARTIGAIMRGTTPLLYGWGKFGEPGTAVQADVELLASPMDPARIAGFARRIFDASSVEFFVLPAGRADRGLLPEFQRDWSAGQRAGQLHGRSPEGPAMPTAAEAPSQEHAARFIRNASAQPRARITRSVRRIDPLPNQPRSRWVAGLATIAFPNRDLPWLGDTAVVESIADLPALGATLSPDTAAESCRIVVDEPRRVVIEATLAGPGLFVLADTYHPDWRLRVTTEREPPRDVEIMRVNRIHRGCLLPEGRHALEFRHRSPTFEWSAAVSGVAWIAAIAWAAILLRQRRVP